MIISKTDNSHVVNSNKPNAKVSFGLNSALLSPETNILLDKVIQKFNLKNQLFADVLQTAHKDFEKKHGAVIDMPHQIGVLSSFKTGLRATLKMEVPLSDGVKLRFSNDQGYRGEYASIEKIVAGANGEEHLKYEISNDWIDVIHDDKKKDVVYTKTQLPSYQKEIFKEMNQEIFTEPPVYSKIKKIDKEIAEYLKHFVDDKPSFLQRIINTLRNNPANAVGVKKHSLF